MHLKKFFRLAESDHLICVTDQLVTSGTSFISSILLARYCIQEEYGLYYLVITLLPFFDNIRISLISTPATVFLPRQTPEQQNKYITASMGLEFLLSLIIILFTSLCSLFFLFILKDQQLAQLLAVSSLLFTGYLGVRQLRCLFYVLHKHRYALTVSLLIAFLQTGLILFFSLANPLHAMQIILIIGIVQCLGGIVGLKLLVRVHAPERSRANIRELLSTNWAYGHWLLWKTIAYTISFQVFPWYLKYCRDNSTVAIFAAVIAVVNIVNPFWIGFTNSLGARIAHAYSSRGRTGLRKTVQGGLKILVPAMAALTLFICVSGEMLLALFFDSRYQGNGFLISCQVLAIMIYVITFPLEQALLTIEKTRKILNIYLCVVCICSLPGFFLVQAYGILGASIGIIATCSITSGLRIFIYSQEMGKN